jgi:hypothetical protein
VRAPPAIGGEKSIREPNKSRDVRLGIVLAHTQRLQ